MNLISEKEVKYNEIPQNVDIRFSFVKKLDDDVYEELFYPVRCRDFLNDVLVAEEQKKEIDVYDFTYDPMVQKIDRDKTRIAMYYGDENKKVIEKNLAILNEIEEQNNLEKTTLTLFEGKNVFLVEGDKFWIRATALISFYSYILRILSYKIKGHWVDSMLNSFIGSNDGKYIHSIYKNLPIFLAKFKEVFSKELPSVTGYEVNEEDYYKLHNNSGIVSILKPDLYNIIYIRNNFFRKAILNEE